MKNKEPFIDFIDRDIDEMYLFIGDDVYGFNPENSLWYYHQYFGQSLNDVIVRGKIDLSDKKALPLSDKKSSDFYIKVYRKIDLIFLEIDSKFYYFSPEKLTWEHLEDIDVSNRNIYEYLGVLNFA